jgi:hypothetical protein
MNDDRDLDCRQLLGFSPNAELGPAEQIRLDILMALRSALDTQTSKQLGGNAANVTGLIQLADALGRLMPPPAPPAPEQHESAHDALTRLAALCRGDEADEETYEGVAAALAQARAENEVLKDELAALRAAGPQPVREPVVEVLPPATTKALPAPEQPQQQAGDAVARANAQNAQRRPDHWSPPDHWKKQSQPWDGFIPGAGGKPYWGPV